jgi:hypothetical protein
MNLAYENGCSSPEDMARWEEAEKTVDQRLLGEFSRETVV